MNSMQKLPKIMFMIERDQAYDRGILKGIVHYAEQNGSWLFVPRHESGAGRLGETDADGLVLRADRADAVLSEIPQNLPIILIGSVGHDSRSIPIVSHNSKIGEMGGEYLLTLGFTCFAYYGIEGQSESEERLEGFRRAVRIPRADPSVSVCRRSADAIDFAEELSLTANWIRSLPKPIGIMACNDDLGLELLEACKAAQVNVPEEAAIVGVDNDLSKCELGSPALSSIELNTIRAGYSAAGMMHQWMRQETAGRFEPVRVEPVRVVVRQSTHVAAVPDEIVIRALDYIRSQADRLIQVRDVADSVFISRRELERRFKKYLNHSIHQEIKIARVGLICRLLLETSDTISEIAARLGFSDAAHIGRYFKDIKGISPSEYRRKNLCTV